MTKIANVFSKVTSFVVAVLFLVLGLVFFFKYDPDAYDMEGKGTVAAIEENYSGDDLTYDVYIDYTVDGQKYERAPYFEYDSSMKVGDEVSFYYMSADPSQIAGSTKDAAPYIGLAFAAVGLIMLAVMVLKVIRGTAF